MEDDLARESRTKRTRRSERAGSKKSGVPHGLLRALSEGARVSCRRPPVPTTAPAGRTLTIRVFPLGALPVVHPTEPLEVVIVAASRPVHWHHREVRHRARLARTPGLQPAVPAAPGWPAPPARIPPRCAHFLHPPPGPPLGGRGAGGARVGSSPRGVEEVARGPRGMKYSSCWRAGFLCDFG